MNAQAVDLGAEPAHRAVGQGERGLPADECGREAVAAEVAQHRDLRGAAAVEPLGDAFPVELAGR